VFRNPYINDFSDHHMTAHRAHGFPKRALCRVIPRLLRLSCIDCAPSGVSRLSGISLCSSQFPPIFLSEHLKSGNARKMEPRHYGTAVLRGQRAASIRSPQIQELHILTFGAVQSDRALFGHGPSLAENAGRHYTVYHSVLLRRQICDQTALRYISPPSMLVSRVTWRKEDAFRRVGKHVLRYPGLRKEGRRICRAKWYSNGQQRHLQLGEQQSRGGWASRKSLGVSHAADKQPGLAVSIGVWCVSPGFPHGQRIISVRADPWNSPVVSGHRNLIHTGYRWR
jgi:hypothetical protein